jgi:Kdo2-lipid IVA lauroyltransferase/acyltransferase
MLAKPRFSRQLLHPRYWLTWLGFLLWWLSAQLPYRWQMIMGALLGRLLSRVAPRRRAIAARNIELCFPQLSAQEQARLVDGVIESVGKAFFETGIAWFMPHARLRKLITLQGIEHLQTAQAQGQGVVLLAMHFTHLELGAAAVSMQFSIDGTYRPHGNSLYDYLQRKGRERHNPTGSVITRGDIRGMVRALRNTRAVWYAPDQDYGREHSIFVPFFGIPAATITATSQIARLGRGVVIPFVQHRREDGRGYSVEILPPLPQFPSDDEYRDTLAISQLIEREVAKQPEQYLWVHRRFKTRPDGEADVYQAVGIERGSRT